MVYKNELARGCKPVQLEFMTGSDSIIIGLMLALYEDWWQIVPPSIWRSMCMRHAPPEVCSIWRESLRRNIGVDKINSCNVLDSTVVVPMLVSNSFGVA